MEFNNIGRSIGRKASVLEKFGNQNNSQSVSLISIHEHEIPTEFSAAAIAVGILTLSLEEGPVEWTGEFVFALW